MESIGIARRSIGLYIRWIGVLLALVLSPAQAEVSDALHSFLEGLHNLRAEFQQTEYDEHHNEVRQSQGTLQLQRPGCFRWEYKTPYVQTIVSDGVQVWFYDPDLEQVTVKPYGKALASSPALLLSSDVPLERNFQLTVGDLKEGLRWIALRPKATDAGFVKAEVGFSGKELRAMELLDSFGQTTYLKFSNLQRNLSLPAGLFHFQPPVGADVMGTGH